MRSFQRSSTVDPVPGAIVALLRRIDQGAGGEARYADQLPELLVGLARTARVESVTASNAIEGVVVDPRRRDALLDVDPPRVHNRSEAEFAGYRLALDDVLQGDPGPLSAALVLRLHRLLGSYTDAGGGRFKLDDNLVVDRDETGRRQVRFTPVPADETPFFVTELVHRTNAALATGDVHPLITIGAFILDLLCIHPFADGNGRVARLLTTMLLDSNGYRAVRYISLEQLVYQRKDEYYAALAASTTGWFDDGRHTVWPWLGFFLECLADAYGRFELRVAASSAGASKQERVREFVLLHGPQAFRIADIRRAVPGVSDQTIHLVLRELRQLGQIASDGTGRSASWQRR